MSLCQRGDGSETRGGRHASRRTRYPTKSQYHRRRGRIRKRMDSRLRKTPWWLKSCART